MVSLNKTSLLFFLLFNIICITSPMNVWRRISSLSSGSSKKKGPKESCLSELEDIFKDNSGLDNFLFALLNLNEESFENDEQCLAKRYFFDMFDTLGQIATDIPDLRTPRDYCHHIIANQGIRNKCILVIKANTGCEADFEGANCIKYIYRSWKEYNGALPGTEELTDYELQCAIRRKYGHRFPEDISDSNLMDALRRERNDYGGILGERLYPGDTSDSELMDDDELLNNIRGTAILDEYDRRMNLPEYFFLGRSYRMPFDKYYAIYLRDAMRDFGGSAFSDLSDFCGNLTEQQRRLTINDQMDPYNYDTNDLNNYDNYDYDTNYDTDD